MYGRPDAASSAGIRFSSFAAIEPENANVEFQIANPGHCKTAFNGFRGTRSPEEGANVVVELAIGARREIKSWETLEKNKELVEVPW